MTDMPNVGKTLRRRSTDARTATRANWSQEAVTESESALHMSARKGSGAVSAWFVNHSANKCCSDATLSPNRADLSKARRSESAASL